MNDKKVMAHIATLNREMGEVKKDCEWLRKEINELLKYIEKVDSRTWWILGGVIITILMQILILLLRLL